MEPLRVAVFHDTLKQLSQYLGAQTVRRTATRLGMTTDQIHPQWDAVGNVPWSFGFSFLPARRYASAGYSDRNVSVRLSVCPSVCPSRAGIVSKRRKLAS